MAPVEQGRHCEKCAMTVIDFTQMTETEIISTLQSKAGQRVCGKMRKEAKNYMLPEIAIEAKHAFNKSSRNHTLYALSIAALLLASCGNSEQIVGQVEVDPNILGLDSLQAVQMDESFQAPQTAKDTLAPPPPPEIPTCGIPKQDVVPLPDYELGKIQMPIKQDLIIEEMGEVEEIPGQEISESIPDTAIIEDESHLLGLVIDPIPSFPGGETALIKYIADSLRYPEPEKSKGIQGRVVARFEVDTSGNLVNIKIVKSVPDAPNFDKEVIRLLSSMPKWEPSTLPNGKKIKVQLALPIRFYLGSQPTNKP